MGRRSPRQASQLPSLREWLDESAGTELSREQVAAVEAATLSPNRTICIVGLAGSGKTTALRAVARAFSEADISAVAAAPSGIAAQKLREETGIRSATLHGLLAEAERSGGLPHGAVLVVDEAAMAETRTLAPLLAHVERADGKTILVGDSAQLPAVGPGGLFAAIVDRVGAVELTKNRRQQDELERRALRAVRAGRGRDYMALAEQQGRLVVCDDALEAKVRLVGDWWSAARDDLTATAMIALRRSDVADLNSAARTLMEAEGRLGHERLVLGGREYAPGDRVVCRRNNRALGVQNGTRGSVEAVDAQRGELVLHVDGGDPVRLTRAYLEAGHIEHGYALTGHSTQGLTLERAFVLGSSDSRLQEWGYVVLSRARRATRLYVTAEQLELESHAGERDERNAVTRFAEALEQPRAERLALDERPARGIGIRARPVIDSAGIGLERERRRLAEGRVEAVRRLERAERELERGGLIRGRRRRPELRVEVERQRQAIRSADERLRELDERGRELRSLARTRSRTRGLAHGRERPQLELEL